MMMLFVSFKHTNILLICKYHCYTFVSITAIHIPPSEQSTYLSVLEVCFVSGHHTSYHLNQHPESQLASIRAEHQRKACMKTGQRARRWVDVVVGAKCARVTSFLSDLTRPMPLTRGWWREKTVRGSQRWVIENLNFGYKWEPSVVDFSFHVTAFVLLIAFLVEIWRFWLLLKGV